MFKKIPYGVKVRVRGNEQDGFIAEYTLHAYRFFPFLDDWINDWRVIERFATVELAKKAAMDKYDSWIDYYKEKEEHARVAKEQRKRNKIVWKHP